MPSVLGLTTYRWNNNIKSVLLLLAFPFLLLALLGGIFFVFGFIYVNQPGADLGMVFQNFNLHSLSGKYGPFDLAEAAIFQYWPIVTGIAVIWVLVGYAFNDAIIHAATGAKAVTRQDQPKLYNILENLCISRGIKTPNLYIIDVPEMNAYASGLDEKSFSITVTRGILDRLNDKEMEAVLAHELTHIINRDCRLLIVTIVFTGMISFAAQMIWRSMQFSVYSRDMRQQRNGGGGMLLLMLIAGVMLFIGYLLALVLRFALSRKREYLADAGSVELTKDPEALISALRKISTSPDVPHVPPEVKQLFFEDPPSAMDLWGLFNTHPAINDRIHVLEELGGLPPKGKSMIPPSG
jgi:heat shock protein HtpX